MQAAWCATKLLLRRSSDLKAVFTRMSLEKTLVLDRINPRPVSLYPLLTRCRLHFQSMTKLQHFYTQQDMQRNQKNSMVARLIGQTCHAVGVNESPCIHELSLQLPVIGLMQKDSTLITPPWEFPKSHK
jgi:hypothetical protein